MIVETEQCQPASDTGTIRWRCEEERIEIGPQTWHYGLVASWWAEFNDDFRPHEIPYFQAAIERSGQPVLDVGCDEQRKQRADQYAAEEALLEAALADRGDHVSPNTAARPASARRSIVAIVVGIEFVQLVCIWSAGNT